MDLDQSLREGIDPHLQPGEEVREWALFTIAKYGHLDGAERLLRGLAGGAFRMLAMTGGGLVTGDPEYYSVALTPTRVLFLRCAVKMKRGGAVQARTVQLRAFPLDDHPVMRPAGSGVSRVWRISDPAGAFALVWPTGDRNEARGRLVTALLPP